MKVAVLHAPGDVRLEERDAPTIIEPTDAIISLSATCVCGSDLWDYGGISPVTQPKPMGHEYCGVVEEVGSAVSSIKPGQFVIGSFFASDNTCSHLSGRLSVVLPAQGVRRRGAGEPVAGGARGRHPGGHPGGSLGRLDPQPPPVILVQLWR